MATAVQQYTDVHEGLAIGCISRGHTELPSGKIAIESAFRYAWGRWSHSHRFPLIRANLLRNDGLLQVIGSSQGRRGSHLAAWEVGRVLRPFLRQDNWTLEDAVELLEQHTGINLAGWEQLANLFIDDITGARLAPGRTRD